MNKAQISNFNSYCPYFNSISTHLLKLGFAAPIADSMRRYRSTGVGPRRPLQSGVLQTESVSRATYVQPTHDPSYRVLLRVPATSGSKNG